MGVFVNRHFDRAHSCAVASTAHLCTRAAAVLHYYCYRLAPKGQLNSIHGDSPWVGGLSYTLQLLYFAERKLVLNENPIMVSVTLECTLAAPAGSAGHEAAHQITAVL